MVHLTNALQTELDKLGSPVRLQTDINAVVKINSKDWAWAEMNGRQADVSTLIALDHKHIQLEEKGIIACTASAKETTEIAVIIDKWIAQRFEVLQLVREHPSIIINEDYQHLKTLPVDALLRIEWTTLAEEIARGGISFRKDVFDKLWANFSHLFPFFSHDNLCFSNMIELPNNDFKSPLIFCEGDTIWVGFFNDNSEEEGKKAFKTKDPDQAVYWVAELLPKGEIVTVNPLTG